MKSNTVGADKSVQLGRSHSLSSLSTLSEDVDSSSDEVSGLQPDPEVQPGDLAIHTAAQRLSRRVPPPQTPNHGAPVNVFGTSGGEHKEEVVDIGQKTVKDIDEEQAVVTGHTGGPPQRTTNSLATGSSLVFAPYSPHELPPSSRTTATNNEGRPLCPGDVPYIAAGAMCTSLGLTVLVALLAFLDEDPESQAIRLHLPIVAVTTWLVGAVLGSCLGKCYHGVFKDPA